MVESCSLTNKKPSLQRNRYTRKRQWGTERSVEPLLSIHEKPSSKKMALSRIAIVLTVFFWLVYVVSTVFRQFIEGQVGYQFTLESISYVIVVTFLTFSALMYLLAREGALHRFSTHVRVPRAMLDDHFAKNQPTITVLVPSYSEEPSVIRKTLLSAALQEYPNIRVVLLLDDDPNPSEDSRRSRLIATRNLITDIEAQLLEPSRRFKKALALINKQSGRKKVATVNQTMDLAKEYLWAAKWLQKQADSEPTEDHVDIFFADQVLRALAEDLHLVGKALLTSSKQGALISMDRIKQLYQRLTWIFSSEITSFERKKYISLSHEANKAMNLNAYISLMGHNYNEVNTPDGIALIPTRSKSAAHVIPDSDFLLTLDADSILLREYCLRLVYFLQQPNNSHVAVTQTPYSSFRGAPSRIERLSGATTDVQHILHQGMSHYGATFWVGANAVIRKTALEDIVKSEWVGGFEVKRYIQDWTVIEDTESSIDLAIHGWRIVNYPERLSYSATPPDFGSLVIQRRRWANGGLLIMPKLWAQIRELKKRNETVSRAELFLRLNYMASIAWSNFGLIFLLAYPYDGRLLSPLVLLAAMPYFVAMASDLKYCRYRYSDIVRIYGFNLILLPVNIAGVLKSLEQALTSKKIPFARTPKVKNRTAVGAPFLLSPLIIVAFSLFTLWRNIDGQNWGNAAFAAFNAFAATWAIVSYIGIGNLIVDLWLAFLDYIFVEVKTGKRLNISNENKPFNWQSILYNGDVQSHVPHHFNNQVYMESNT